MTADVDLEETDADRAYQPKPGCCEDCDEALEDLAAWEAQLAEKRRRARAALAEVCRWARRVFEQIGRAVRAAVKAIAELCRRLEPAWRRATEIARQVLEARRVRLRAVRVDYRRRLLCRRRRAR